MQKILSAKNKRMLILGAAILFALILGSFIVKAYKSGMTGIGDIAKASFAYVKSLISFTSLVILLSAGLALYLDSFFGVSGATVLAVALGTLTTGAAVVSTFNSTYVPKYFYYTAATQLTGVKITVQGDGVIFDSDANGLNHVGVSRVAGQVTNSFVIRIANGLITGKNVIWEFTNSAAQTPVIYVNADNSSDKTGNGPMYLQFLRQVVLANSGQDFTKFATLSFPAAAAADVFNILYNDGTQQQMNRADLQALLSYQQNVVNTPVYTIDNYAQTIDRVNALVAAQQTAYVQRWVPSVSGGMVSQVVNR
jgi:hypothetical protein